MNAGRREEIEMVAQSLQMSGEFVPAAMLRELLADVDALTAEDANAKAALITAAQLMRDANARADALSAELARVRGELAAVKAEFAEVLEEVNYR